MAIPKFEEIMAPALQLFADGNTHRHAEVDDKLAQHFNLTVEDLNEMLPSGTERRWRNRVGWACYDLSRAGFLDRPQRGAYVITDLGRTEAAKNPTTIDRNYLLKFPAYTKFRETKNKKNGVEREPASKVPQTDNGQSQTPRETIETAFQLIQADLKYDLLRTVKKMDPIGFEQLVLKLLLAMGYGGSLAEAAKMTKTSNDEGIDGVINEDKLGLDVIYIQAKRWEQPVGRPEIQRFVGALAGQKADKGIFITTSEFTRSAVDYAKDIPQKVVLIDGDRMADLMIQYNIGIAPLESFELKRIDNDYFEEL
jgi:restriction system protein